MKINHIPTIDARYWTAITLASIFGTNMGDFYAYNSGLGGPIGGVPILVGLFLLIYVVERFDKIGHEFYYWLCIIIMRTGATNIADYMAGRHFLHIDRWLISGVLTVVIFLLAWWAARDHNAAHGSSVRKTLPDTDPRYWVAMLAAGVFGTVLGDALEHLIGQGVSAIILSVVLALALLIYRKGVFGSVYGYWLTVSVARTAGTAIGDWLAENKIFNIGLNVCTLATGVAFVAVLLAWRSRPKADTVIA